MGLYQSDLLRARVLSCRTFLISPTCGSRGPAAGLAGGPGSVAALLRCHSGSRGPAAGLAGGPGSVAALLRCHSGSRGPAAGLAGGPASVAALLRCHSGSRGPAAGLAGGPGFSLRCLAAGNSARMASLWSIKLCGSRPVGSASISSLVILCGGAVLEKVEGWDTPAPFLPG